jgi:hypothetical protein
MDRLLHPRVWRVGLVLAAMLLLAGCSVTVGNPVQPAGGEETLPAATAIALTVEAGVEQTATALAEELMATLTPAAVATDTPIPPTDTPMPPTPTPMPPTATPPPPTDTPIPPTPTPFPRITVIVTPLVTLEAPTPTFAPIPTLITPPLPGFSLPQLPNLKITSLRFDPYPPKQGEPVTVYITVLNDSDVQVEGDFVVVWWAGVNFPRPACSWNLQYIPMPRTSEDVSCRYAGYGSWYASLETKAVVDTENEIEELNEDDNEFRMTISVSRP